MIFESLATFEDNVMNVMEVRASTQSAWSSWWELVSCAFRFGRGTV